MIDFHCGMVSSLFTSMVRLFGQENTADLVEHWAGFLKETDFFSKKLND
jgi:hypothetical protein